MPAAIAAGIRILIQSLESDWTDVTMLSPSARLEGNQRMTNEEMQRAMNFIVQMQEQSTVKLNRLGIGFDAPFAARKRAEKRGKETERRIRALLKKTRDRQARRLVHQVEVRPRNKTAIDGRLEALANLGERQINNGRNGKQ